MVALSRESTSVMSGGAGTRVRWGHSWRPSDVQTLRHMFLIIQDSNNIMVEEFRVISCYQRAPLFVVASLGGLMGFKPPGARDLKSNYAHSGERLRQMEWMPSAFLPVFSASWSSVGAKAWPLPQHISLETPTVASRRPQLQTRKSSFHCITCCPLSNRQLFRSASLWENELGRRLPGALPPSARSF